MLVLSRKTNESIVIGDNIEVVVLDIKDGTVKIGIQAPHSVRVFRKEIFDEIKNENVLAGESNEDMVKQLIDSRLD